MKGAITLFLVICCFVSNGQEVDLVRLDYSEAELTAKQIGMAASPDGKQIAFVYKDKTIKIFDVVAGRFISRFSGPYNSLLDVQLTSNGRIALIAKQEIQVWDWKLGKLLLSFPLPRSVTKTAYSGKHNLLAAGQYGGLVSIIDLNKLVPLKEILYKKKHVSALAFHPDGKTIAIGVGGFAALPGGLKLFDIATGQEKAKSSLGSEYYNMAAFNKKGDKIISGGFLAYELDGNDLHLIKKFTPEWITYDLNRLYCGAFISEDRVMMLTETQSFDVSDLKTGTPLFTTTREKGRNTMKAPGLGIYNVFPLNEKGDKVIVNATKNNINQIYDSKTNSMVGYFFSDSNDDFAIVSRDGRVHGTPSALAKVYWTSRKSNKKTSLESTFEKGFTPKLLSQIIGDSDLQQVAFEVDDVMEKIPVVILKSVNGTAGQTVSSFESGQKMTKVEIEITQNQKEVTEVKLFQNSKLVKIISNQGKSLYAFDVSLTTSFGEQNYFFVTAGSKSGIESEKVKFTVSYKGATEAKPKLFLVTIGINNYKNPKYNLNYAQADADGVDQIINQKSNTLFQGIVAFSIRNDRAIKQNIFSALEEIKSKALEQDMLLFYYAGHGVMSEGIGRDKEFFIVPHDVIQLYGKDELLFEKAISANELKTFTQQINAQKQVFILDACQSAGALEALENRNRGAAEEKAIAQLARSTGTFWITSTGSDQFASEFDKLGHGIFTYALLEGIQGAADTNGDHKLTIRELSTYIENKVPELSEQLKGAAQFPSAYSFGNDFPLVVYEHK